MSGHLFGLEGHDHRDKLLCGMCWLMKFPEGTSNTKASCGVLASLEKHQGHEGKER